MGAGPQSGGKPGHKGHPGPIQSPPVHVLVISIEGSRAQLYVHVDPSVVLHTVGVVVVPEQLGAATHSGGTGGHEGHPGPVQPVSVHSLVI